MLEKILTVENLSVTYYSSYSKRSNDTYKKSGIQNINFSLTRGEICGIIGESGGGKSTLLSAIMGLLDEKADISGKIIYKGKEVKKENIKELRFKEIGLVFQNQEENLNPSLTVGTQIAEILCKKIHDKTLLRNELDKILQAVGLDISIKEKYPHEISGGMRQRIFIAMAICLNPPLLLIDEPTTALDPSSKKQILNLLKTIHEKNGTSILAVSHDLEVIENLTENMMVFLNGFLIEKGKTKNILEEAKHPYTAALLQSSTYLNPWKDLWGIKETEENNTCPFYNRCTQKSEECLTYTPYLPIHCKEGAACFKNGIEKILTVKNIIKTFYSGKEKIEAVKNCSIRVRHGEVVALLGKSGSGKTTLLHLVAGLLKKDSGKIFFLQNEIEKNNLLSEKNALQIIEQDSFSSMNSSLSVQEVVAEPSVILYNKRVSECKETVVKYLQETGFGIDENLLSRKTGELSGGQRQKIAIARALSMQPKLLLADEITSMLDDSSKVNIMRLLKRLQYEIGFAMLLVTHDINLVKKVADYVYCMDNGEIIKEGSVRKIFAQI
ncbi:ABC transporter ATP-binding protein [Treponema pedis]|uniref:Peptide ABC transporter ATP-binding protein n=1 Tax=Treponema pedis str. T A4 TaxID=1291379 RepID=S6A4P3_9SPIR|nr:ABC transporter ATP-binding protein [Treponema pedis]AGT44616.1 peptide ABC transporter ATP-binding protein [Treponema pedis str. T A4]